MELNQSGWIDQQFGLRERLDEVTPRIKKYVKEKLAALGWPMRDENFIFGWHPGFVVIDFVHKPDDFFEILTPIAFWENGSTDSEIDKFLEKRFSKKI